MEKRVSPKDVQNKLINPSLQITKSIYIMITLAMQLLASK